MKEFVILVDEKDNPVEKEEKIRAHELGLLHRAFSVFIFNSQHMLLLQKRAKTKYHSGGLWSNTCCSHPRPDEDIFMAAHRRLKEEMGFDTNLKEIFTFCYKANLDNNLIEHEYDHVFIGKFDGKPILNPEEAENYKWISLQELDKDIKENSSKYSFWLKSCLPGVATWAKPGLNHSNGFLNYT
ncbi:MAG: isopentenyl-diphosphate Delta-isomerase [Candidatus Babeliales bacterium]